MVDVYFLGEQAFKIKGKDAQVLVNPSRKSSDLGADIVLFSRKEHVPWAKGEKPFVIAGPGEYEIGGINVVGSPLIVENGEERTFESTVYQLLVDGVSFAYLGEVLGKLSQRQIEVLGNIDILICEVEKNPKAAVEIVAQLEPAIVLPIHNGEADSKGIGEFLKQIGSSEATEKKLSISKDKLPEETQVKLLEVTRG